MKATRHDTLESVVVTTHTRTKKAGPVCVKNGIAAGSLRIPRFGPVNPDPYPHLTYPAQASRMRIVVSGATTATDKCPDYNRCKPQELHMNDANSNAPMSLTAAMNAHFGKKPGQNLAGFRDELKALTPQDKAEIKDGLVKLGYNIRDDEPVQVAA